MAVDVVTLRKASVEFGLRMNRLSVPRDSRETSEKPVMKKRLSFIKTVIHCSLACVFLPPPLSSFFKCYYSGTKASAVSVIHSSSQLGMLSGLLCKETIYVRNSATLLSVVLHLSVSLSRSPFSRVLVSFLVAVWFPLCYQMKMLQCAKEGGRNSWKKGWRTKLTELILILLVA